ncbi:hypothetical protein OUZ56_013297 [Daphnia magna]|uniref:Uncharacterized protein n=1 Tax=Daphnia magna TaxID=35525 RepID=A0ABQ9Z5H4_9CRUS|nr:hypothetical protein OUZ56_013297 [Daphnia magna]
MVVVGGCARNDLKLRLELLSSKHFPFSQFSKQMHGVCQTSDSNADATPQESPCFRSISVSDAIMTVGFLISLRMLFRTSDLLTLPYLYQ